MERSIAISDPLVNPTDDEVRLGMELANRVLWAVDPRNRRCVYAGLTWGDFKKAVEALGVTDTTDLGSIEYGITKYGGAHVIADQDDCGAVEIREMR